jgi:hypothetical protein
MRLPGQGEPVSRGISILAFGNADGSIHASGGNCYSGSRSKKDQCSGTILNTGDVTKSYCCNTLNGRCWKNLESPFDAQNC